MDSFFLLSTLIIEVVQLEGRVNEFVSIELGHKVGPRLRELAPRAGKARRRNSEFTPPRAQLIAHLFKRTSSGPTATRGDAVPHANHVVGRVWGG